MKIVLGKSEKIFWPLLIYMIIQNFVSNEIYLLLGIGICIYFLVSKYKGKFFLPFAEFKILLIFLVWGILTGFILLSNNKCTFRDILRDIFYFANPIVFTYMGAIYARRKININLIFNTFIIVAALLSFQQIIGVLQNISNLSQFFTVQQWRNVSGDGGNVCAVALAVILSKIIPKDQRLSKVVSHICEVLIIIAFFISLSRTNTILVIIFYLVLLFRRDNAKKVVGQVMSGVIVALVLVMVLLLVLPDSISIAYMNKISSSFTEIGTASSWDNPMMVQQNWRGYETYSLLQEFQKGNIIEQIFGCGFGKKIYVGKYAYTLLGQVDSNGLPESTIAILHNGYATMLIKLGVLGVIVYLYLYLLLMKKGWKACVHRDDINSRMLLAIGISFSIVTYFLNGLFVATYYFPMLLLLGYTVYSVEKGAKRKAAPIS